MHYEGAFPIKTLFFNLSQTKQFNLSAEVHDAL